MPPPPSPSTTSITASTRHYYDTPAANAFYTTIWGGGSNISIGIYDSPADPIALASQRTVARMAALIVPITPATRILDMGAGYGGSARWLARTFGCRVTCLNLSGVQNERNRAMCKGEGLVGLVGVVEGSFEDVPAAEGEFDVVWSQDAFLHSGAREKVVKEIDRVLVKEGGAVVFADIMEGENVDRPAMAEVIARLPVDKLGTVRFYQDEMREAFGEGTFEDLSPHLVTHYERVLDGFEESISREKDGVAVDMQFVEKTRKGLRASCAAAVKGHLVWGIFSFKR